MAERIAAPAWCLRPGEDLEAALAGGPAHEALAEQSFVRRPVALLRPPRLPDRDRRRRLDLDRVDPLGRRDHGLAVDDTQVAADGGRRLDLDQEVAVLAAVVDASGEERIDLFGASAGGPVAAAYAAAEPGRVRRAILYGTYASGSEIADEGARESILALVRRHWGLGSRVLADIFMTAATPAPHQAAPALARRGCGPRRPPRPALRLRPVAERAARSSRRPRI